jgi:hypothetical protein
VELRQEWTLVGYSIGDLDEVTALNPGAVIQSGDQLVRRATRAAQEATNVFSSSLTESLVDRLNRMGSVDTVVTTTTDVNSGGVAGIGLGAGILGSVVGLGVGVGSESWASTDITGTTHVDTTLNVNRTVQQAANLVSQAIRRSETLTEGSQRAVSGVMNQLAPLVSQTSNAFRWRVYENYAVCTLVDGVHRLEQFAMPMSGSPAFSAFDVLVYRPFFEPALLDRTLAKHFDQLAATQARVPFASIAITYDPLRDVDSRADFQFGASSGSVALPRGDSIRTVRGAITLAPPMQPGESANGRFAVPRTRIEYTTPSVRVFGAELGNKDVIVLDGWPNVSQVEVWFGPESGAPVVALTNPGSSQTFTVTVPSSAGEGTTNALVAHINAHRSYYLGVLAAAAMSLPSLRQDAPELQGIDPDVWRLPIVGFDGDTVLAANPVANIPNDVVAGLLNRDPGAGTLVQVAARGSYGEMLQGLLQLGDATSLPNTLHPLLKQIGPAPWGPFPEAISETGNNGGTSTVPIPSVTPPAVPVQ